MADGRAHVLALVAPGATADDTVAWIAALAARDPRRSVRWPAVVGLVPAILDPLPYVAVHVVKPQRIRLERPDRRRLSAIPLTAALATIGVPCGRIVAPGKGSSGASARGILHSLSVSSRYSLPVTFESQATYCLASFQLTLIT